jgi:REP element-mobilizing transposase RayT
MVLNPVGMIMVEEILRTPLLRKNVAIDTWIVMPNHVHLIVEISPNAEMDTVETARCAVSQHVAKFIPLPRLKPNSLGSIVGRIKATAAWRIHKAGYYNFVWQERFHDRILRTERAVDNVRSYIQMNPVMWDRDRNNRPSEMDVDY